MDTNFSLSALIVLIAVALIFDFLNGLHDAANSIATVVVNPRSAAAAIGGLAGAGSDERAVAERPRHYCRRDCAVTVVRLFSGAASGARPCLLAIRAFHAFRG